MSLTPEPRSRRSRDLRAYASSTQVRLLFGGVLLFLLVGTALVAAIYGPSAAAGSVVCILAGALPIGLIFLGLEVIGWMARRGRDG
jgi:hypothetical protein